MIPLTLVSIPRSRQLWRLGLKASANRDLCPQRRDSSLLLGFFSEQTQKTAEAVGGRLRDRRGSAPSLAQEEPPTTASHQRSHSSPPSRDFLPCRHRGGQRLEIYSRLLPDMRERWGRAHSKSLPICQLRFLLGFSQSLASFAREPSLGEETEKGRLGGRVLRFRGRGWFRCCGWYFAVGEALRSPGTKFPMGDWENWRVEKS